MNVWYAGQYRPLTCYLIANQVHHSMRMPTPLCGHLRLMWVVVLAYTIHFYMLECVGLLAIISVNCILHMSHVINVIPVRCVAISRCLGTLFTDVPHMLAAEVINNQLKCKNNHLHCPVGCMYHSSSQLEIVGALGQSVKFRLLWICVEPWILQWSLVCLCIQPACCLFVDI